MQRQDAQLQCFQNEGISFICRYYTSNTTSGKLLTKSEAEALSNRGFYIVPVYQDIANDPKYFGYDNGLSDGRTAIGKAEVVGQPYNTAIYFAVDFDPSTTEAWNAVKDYFRGVQDAVHEYYQINGQRWKIGVYGGYNVVAELDGYAGITKTWQTRSWSGEQDYLNRNIYQYEIDTQSTPVYFCDKRVDKNASDGTHGGFRL
ncbi:MAG: hypothetical protein PWQ96_175 [Clostridia bacterium]|nr:hypothetical protein [Clostridia bacterium]